MKNICKTIITALSMTLTLASLAASFISYKPANIAIGQTSIMILPAVGQTTTNLFTSNGVSAYGDYIIASNKVLWCVVAGTNDTTIPAIPTDGDVVSSQVTWRVVHPVRNIVMIRNMDTNAKVNIAFGNTAVVNKGIALRAAEGWISDQVAACPQGAIYAISDTTNTTIAIQEN